MHFHHFSPFTSSPLAPVVGVDSTGRKPELVDRLMDFAVRGTTSNAEPVKKAGGAVRRLSAVR